MIDFDKAAVFKLKPIPDRLVLVKGELTDLEHAAECLNQLNHLGITASAIELLCGPLWKSHRNSTEEDRPATEGPLLVVALEGTEHDVQWLHGQLLTNLQTLGVRHIETQEGESADDFRKPFNGDDFFSGHPLHGSRTG